MMYTSMPNHALETKAHGKTTTRSVISTERLSSDQDGVHRQVVDQRFVILLVIIKLNT